MAPNEDTTVTRDRAVARLRERLGPGPDLPHLEEALTHPSYANEQRRGERCDNQRLEFLGDAVADLCVSELLMEAFPEQSEGELTMIRAALVNADALASVARELGLTEALLLGRGADASGDRHLTNVLADALEALLAAVFLDRGLDGARALTRLLLGARIEALVAGGGTDRDAKSRLQELVQARGLEPPRYRVVAEEGPPHARSFTVEVVAPWDRPVRAPEGGDRPGAGPEDPDPRAQLHARAVGRSKRSAETAAAAAALALLDELE